MTTIETSISDTEVEAIDLSEVDEKDRVELLKLSTKEILRRLRREPKEIPHAHLFRLFSELAKMDAKTDTPPPPRTRSVLEEIREAAQGLPEDRAAELLAGAVARKKEELALLEAECP